jgi:predicted GIY-YIG superfamily endonuclease
MKTIQLKDLTLEYVYILMCNNQRTYVGHTSNIEERLERHVGGRVPATKNIRPVKLLTYIAFTDKYKAIAFEKYLKSGSGRAFLKKRLI